MYTRLIKLALIPAAALSLVFTGGTAVGGLINPVTEASDAGGIKPASHYDPTPGESNLEDIEEASALISEAAHSIDEALGDSGWSGYSSTSIGADALTIHVIREIPRKLLKIAEQLAGDIPLTVEISKFRMNRYNELTDTLGGRLGSLMELVVGVGPSTDESCAEVSLLDDARADLAESLIREHYADIPVRITRIAPESYVPPMRFSHTR